MTIQPTVVAPVESAVAQADAWIPFCRTTITPEARDAVSKVLAGGWVTMGAETALFEGELASWIGAPEAIAVSSCTAALELSLRALRLPAGAAVLTPTITFCGAVHAIVHAGLRPVFVDVDEDTLTASAEGVATAAVGGAAAMVIQHMAGYPVDAAAMADAAGLHPGLIVEDAAHGIGARVHDQAVGTVSRATCFSFYATKNLPIGEGGAITTADPEFGSHLRCMRLHGMSSDAWRRYGRGGSWRYTVDTEGLKANFTDVQAAIGRAQLARLAAWQDRRAVIAATYDAFLSDVPGLELPPRPDLGGHAWHLYIVRIGPEFGMDRDRVIEALAERGIGTSVHFIPVHQQRYFRRFVDPESGGLPIADRVFPRLLSLPLFPGLSGTEVARVCETLRQLSRRGRS